MREMSLSAIERTSTVRVAKVPARSSADAVGSGPLAYWAKAEAEARSAMDLPSEYLDGPALRVMQTLHGIYCAGGAS